MSAENTSETSNQILKQVEYYFSDSNLLRDKFLKEELAKNVDGYVSIEIIASFNRMKAISTDLEFITESLKKSTRLQVSEDGKMVKRLDPLPESIDTGKTLYSKGWPSDTTIEKVQEFFNQFGKTLSVRLRKKTDKSFKGSLLVDFDTEETVTKIIAEKPKLNGDIELIYQTFKQFNDEKKEEKEKFLANSDKKRKAKKEAERDGENDDEEKSEEKAEETMVPGCIVVFKGIGAGKNIHRGDIKEIFSQYGDVQFVGYNHDDVDGNVRFKTAESAQRAVEALTTAKKEIGGQVPTFSIMEGEEEKTEWEKILEKKKNAGNNNNKKGNNNRGGKKPFKKFAGKGKGFKGNKKAKVE
ncbi:hypothetical protein DICPUDRAFT_52105 [Dictyostelium purpureum]|uniref:Lupus La protein n=1 Tax=Dictyostelium purpureum TaxID=5786 RepID=F0Z703_DICPU|nr:uncharacterized protein DICPUDRAFT_52105 [Dictyostelium purpureum]EGC40246.1 hypothetical protein DICPUDRAFT_52105 [Dictyostelium purpureum]|eukprot:XP_003283182.1 hypothetical protein DICPUDRAFT_52105 [Dictyostelium purpureum]